MLSFGTWDPLHIGKNEQAPKRINNLGPVIIEGQNLDSLTTSSGAIIRNSHVGRVINEGLQPVRIEDKSRVGVVDSTHGDVYVSPRSVVEEVETNFANLNIKGRVTGKVHNLHGSTALPPPQRVQGAKIETGLWNKNKVQQNLF